MILTVILIMIPVIWCRVQTNEVMNYEVTLQVTPRNVSMLKPINNMIYIYNYIIELLQKSCLQGSYKSCRTITWYREYKNATIEGFKEFKKKKKGSL